MSAMANMFDAVAKKDKAVKASVVAANLSKGEEAVRGKPATDTRYDGVVPFLVKLPPHVHAGLKVHKAISGEDMQDTIIRLLESELSNEIGLAVAQKKQ